MDVRTLVLTLMAVFFVSAIMIFFFYRQNRQLAGLRDWAIGFAVISVGEILLVSRGFIPDFLSIVIANGLIQLALCFFVVGVIKFCGCKVYYPWFIGFFILTWLPYFFLFDDPQYLNLRMHTNDFAQGVLFFIGACYLMFKPKPHWKFAAQITALAFLFAGGNSFLRSYTLLSKGNDTTIFMGQSGPNALFYFCMVISLLVMMIGFVMLISEELRGQLAQALRTEKLARHEQNDFWGMVSHEFKTPLATIDHSAQFLEYVLDPQQDEKAVNAATRIQRATQRLSKLVDKTLYDQWLTATLNEESLHKDVFNLSELLRRLAFEYHVEFDESKSSRRPVFLLGDETLISTAISSLVDNAIKYGDRLETVKISLVADTCENVTIDVFNSGPPIQKEDKERIFDKFYSSSYQKELSGSGLGLYNTRRIITLHEGMVTLLEGVGTTFRVELKSE